MWKFLIKFLLGIILLTGVRSATIRPTIKTEVRDTQDVNVNVTSNQNDVNLVSIEHRSDGVPDVTTQDLMDKLQPIPDDNQVNGFENSESFLTRFTSDVGITMASDDRTLGQRSDVTRQDIHGDSLDAMIISSDVMSVKSLNLTDITGTMTSVTITGATVNISPVSMTTDANTGKVNTSINGKDATDNIDTTDGITHQTIITEPVTQIPIWEEHQNVSVVAVNSSSSDGVRLQSSLRPSDSQIVESSTSNVTESDQHISSTTDSEPSTLHTVSVIAPNTPYNESNTHSPGNDKSSTPFKPITQSSEQIRLSTKSSDGSTEMSTAMGTSTNDSFYPTQESPKFTSVKIVYSDPSPVEAAGLTETNASDVITLATKGRRADVNNASSVSNDTLKSTNFPENSANQNASDGADAGIDTVTISSKTQSGIDIASNSKKGSGLHSNSADVKEAENYQTFKDPETAKKNQDKEGWFGGPVQIEKWQGDEAMLIDTDSSMTSWDQEVNKMEQLKDAFLSGNLRIHLSEHGLGDLEKVAQELGRRGKGILSDTQINGIQSEVQDWVGLITHTDSEQNRKALANKVQEAMTQLKRISSNPLLSNIFKTMLSHM